MPIVNRQSSIVNPLVALFTGGGDRPYVFGLTTALTSKGAVLDLIGSDDLDFPEIHDNPGVNFLNLRGSHRSDASFLVKVSRVLLYYFRLIRYAATAPPKIFHILWNNKFESFDRTLLMLYYRLMGKRIVFTAHNVNAGRRDLNDTPFNRGTLRVQYRLADHIFVHTEKMKGELIETFGVQQGRVTVIPFPVNNSVPNTRLTCAEAKQRLGVGGRAGVEGVDGLEAVRLWQEYRRGSTAALDRLVRYNRADTVNLEPLLRLATTELERRILPPEALAPPA